MAAGAAGAAGHRGGSTEAASGAGARPRRLSFSVGLVALAVGVTLLAGATLGVLAWREKRSLSRQLMAETMARTAHLAAAHAELFLRDAEAVARLGPQLVAQGVLDPGKREDLERFTLATLRAHPRLAWVSYGDRDDRFVGAWRDGAGEVYLNRSEPAGRRIRLVEDRVRPDGGREPVRRVDDHGYRPRERPYFQLAQRQRAVAWTEPYEFYAGGGLGISAIAPLLDGAGEVRGVFTVDLSLDGLGSFLDGLAVSPRGRVFVASGGGALVLGPRQGGGAAAAGLAAAVTAAGAAGADPGAPGAFEHRGERYLGRSVPLAAGERPWRVVVTVPETDYTEPVDAVARRIAGAGLLALGLVAAAGVAAARRLARPLRRLAGRARLIGGLGRDGRALPRDEIGALAATLREAARATRGRTLASDLLGRYVSRDLAERWLRERRSHHLRPELRDVAVLMSDLRGFSALSERLGPEAVFGLLDRYLERMTAVILAHGGSVNAFIGDGILALFGAPTRHGDDVARAVRCAWAMQQALEQLNAEGRAQGLPELRMGIGLHAGGVVAGTIGGQDRAAYTVVGPVVNRTARMVDLAWAGEILLSDTVVARAGGAALVGPPRRAMVKGVAVPLTLFPLAGVEPAPLPDQAGAAAAAPAGPDSALTA
jgi:class 3 adenylate cyclase